MKHISAAFLLCLMATAASSQIPDSAQTLQPSPADTATTTAMDTSELPTVNDALTEEVDYGSQDTAFLDAVNREMHLIGEAYARFQGTELTAHYIIIDLENNLAKARGAYNPFQDQVIGRPMFREGQTQFESDRIEFNFKTKKGIITDFRTKEQDIYILGEKTKFISGEAPGAKDDGDAAFLRNGEFTTCDHDEPHYALKSTKIKTVLDKVAVMGPTNIQISRVPTPVWLPFAFFPLTKQESSGLIFPRDYEYSENLGFGFRNVGYYFPLNDQMDLTMLGDIYFNGTYALRPTFRYKKRYKYSGNLNLNWRSQLSEFIVADTALAKGRINSFSIRWTHNQDRKAHPSRSFGGSLNFQTNNDIRRTFNDAQSVSNNTVRSNFNYRKSFQGKPYSFTAGLNHSQNNSTREVTVSFPNLDFRMSRVYPLKRKNAVGKEKWYEKIGVQYSANAQNKFVASDSTLFTQQTLEDARFGFKHEMDAQVNLKMLKFFTLTPSVDYKETYFSHTLRKRLIDSLFIENDTTTLPDGQLVIDRDTTFGQIMDDIESGFSPYRELNFRASLNTQLYSTLQFKKGWLRGVRYTMRPTVSFNYRPDQTDPRRDYIRQVATDLRPAFADTMDYNKFNINNRVYSANPSEEQMNMSYGIGGTIEGKYFSKKDSTFKKLKLIKTLNIGGSRNFARDSLQYSPLSLSANTVILQGVTTLRFNASWDFYALGENGNRIEKFAWEDGGQLLRFQGATLRIRNTINSQTLKKIFSGNKKSSTARRKQRTASANQDNLVDILQNLRLEHNMNINWQVMPDTSFTEITRNIVSLRISRLQLTPNWNVRIGNIGYDFLEKDFTYPDFGIYRNLHCWEAGIDVQPQRGTFNFYIRVKPSSFSFLNLPYRRNNVDGPLDF